YGQGMEQQDQIPPGYGAQGQDMSIGSGSGNLTQQFQHPDGVLTMRHPANWQPQCAPAETAHECVLRCMPNGDPMIVVGADAVGSLDQMGFQAYFQNTELQAMPMSASVPLMNPAWSQGMIGRQQDFQVMGNAGQPGVMRLILIGRPPVAAVLCVFCFAGNLQAYTSVINEMASSIQLQSANVQVMQALVGYWQGASTQQSMAFWDGSGNQVAGTGGPVSTSHTLAFFADGSFESDDFAGVSATTGMGSAYGGAGTQGRGRFAVVGNQLFLAGPGSFGTALIGQGFLQLGSIRYVRTR
ncbi:MAG: hypothetical protein KAY32_13000, partial [Candidatus Eisenbacteria sp.]|nr:hypothetical protein [Candidatus Eisenbacteria bacterium]